MKEIHKHSCRLLRAETLRRTANAGQKGPEELRNTPVDDHADEESLTVKSCPRAIVAASPRRGGDSTIGAAMVTPSPAPAKLCGLALKSGESNNSPYGRFEVVIANNVMEAVRHFLHLKEMRLSPHASLSVSHCTLKARKTTHPHRSEQPDHLSRARRQEMFYQWWNCWRWKASHEVLGTHRLICARQSAVISCAV